MCLFTASLNESMSGKLATASGRAFNCSMASGIKSIYSNLYWFGFGDKSLSGNTGILCKWVGHSLKEVLPQIHKQFYRRDIDGHLPIFRLCSRFLQPRWLSIAETLDLVS